MQNSIAAQVIERHRASVPALGIDFGGMRIEAILQGANGRTLWEQRVLNARTYDIAVAAIAEFVVAADIAGGTACTIGIVAPGSALPRTGVIRNSNSLYLSGRSFGGDLTAVLGRPVRLVNNATCLALSEATNGAAVGARSVFALVISTGVVAMVANLLDPEVVVLGGGMSNVAEIYAELPTIVRHYAFSDLWEGRIVPARWGDASGVRGAARLWTEDA